MSRLAADLDEARKVPLGTYDVLVQLAEHGGTLRLKDLVAEVVLSQPGLSRKVARLEEEGLVQRKPDPSDGRGVLVKITRSGRAALRSASVVHIAGIEREFTSRISDEEAAVLARVYQRLLSAPPSNGLVPQADPHVTHPRAHRAPESGSAIRGICARIDALVLPDRSLRRYPICPP